MQLVEELVEAEHHYAIAFGALYLLVIAAGLRVSARKRKQRSHLDS
jgi:hypothetical protein